MCVLKICSAFPSLSFSFFAFLAFLLFLFTFHVEPRGALTCASRAARVMAMKRNDQYIVRCRCWITYWSKMCASMDIYMYVYISSYKKGGKGEPIPSQESWQRETRDARRIAKRHQREKRIRQRGRDVNWQSRLPPKNHGLQLTGVDWQPLKVIRENRRPDLIECKVIKRDWLDWSASHIKRHTHTRARGHHTSKEATLEWKYTASLSLSLSRGRK